MAAPQEELAELKVRGRGDPSRGLSVDFLRGKLLRLLGVATGGAEKVYDIEPRVRELSAAPLVCPRDGRRGCALVDVAPDDLAGAANWMISYGWGYRVAAISEALAAFCDSHRHAYSEIVVWICFACINQHRVKEAQAKGVTIPFEEFESTFKERVTGIGRMLCLLAPWRDPLYLQRVWCVFEMFTATTSPNVEVELILPPEEAADFNQTLMVQGLGAVWDVLGQLKVENAKASVEQDRINILQLLESNTGYDYVNSNIRKKLQAWFVEMAVADVRAKMRASQIGMQPEEAAQIVAAGVRVTHFWQLQGADMKGVAAFGDGILDFCEAAVGADTKDYSFAAGNVAWLAMLRSEYPRAISMYTKILDIQETLIGKDSKEVGATLYDLGWALCSKGDYEEAIEVMGKAETVQARALGRGDAACGRTIRDKGEALIELGQYEDALRAYDEAVATLEAACGRFHVDTACALKHQARCFVALGDAKRAMDQLDAVLLEEASSQGTESPGYGVTLLLLADALRHYGWLNRALYIVEHVQPIFDNGFGKRETKFGAWALWVQGQVLRDMGLVDLAGESYAAARAIAGSVHGEGSLRYQHISKELAELSGWSLEAHPPIFPSSARPWGFGAREAVLLQKFKEMDPRHVGLLELGEVIRMIKSVMARDVDPEEVTNLVQLVQIYGSTRSRIGFQAFTNLGEVDRSRETSSVAMQEAISGYFNKMVDDHAKANQITVRYFSQVHREELERLPNKELAARVVAQEAEIQELKTRLHALESNPQATGTRRSTSKHEASWVEFIGRAASDVRRWF